MLKPELLSQLSSEDQGHMKAVDGKASILRDRVRQVVNGTVNGAYFSGDGGLGKTYQIITMLNVLCRDKYLLQNSNITPKGTFEILKTDNAWHSAKEMEATNERPEQNRVD